MARDELMADGPRSPWPWRLAAAVLIVIVGVVVLTHRHHHTERAVRPEPSPSPTASAAIRRFVPPQRTAHGRTTVRLTFPDGSTADVSYPARLRLAEMGVRPYLSAMLGGCCFREFVVPPQGAAWFAQAGPALRRLAGAAGGRVALTPNMIGTTGVGPPMISAPYSPFLVYTFGAWTVGVPVYGYERMVFDQLTAWAANLHGRVTQDGFLVFHGTGTLKLSKPGMDTYGDVDSGPQLWFGQDFATRYQSAVVSPTRMVVLAPTRRCAPTDLPPQPSVRHATCPDPHMHLWVGGDETFAKAVTAGVRVSNVRLAE